MPQHTLRCISRRLCAYQTRLPGAQVIAPSMKLKGFFWSKVARPTPQSVWAALQPPVAALTVPQLAALEALFPQVSATPMAPTASKGTPYTHAAVLRTSQCSGNRF